MSERESNLLEECVGQLVDRKGPAAVAWLTRVHRTIIRLYPRSFVFRLEQDLDDVTEWMETAELERLSSALLPSVEFDHDLDGTRIRPEGGWCSFRWNGVEYSLVSVKIFGQRRDHSYTWVVCPDRAAGEALTDAIGRPRPNQRAAVMVFEEEEWEEAPRLEADLRGYTWDSVVLPEAAKSRMRRAADLFFQSEHVYSQLEVPWKLGFLFLGPPGTGKTLTTKILAATCGVPFLYVRELRSSYGGSASDETIREMFQGARDRAPCILCLEDLDAMVTENLRSTFLNQLDGLEEDYRGVLTVATTNHPEKLDPALLYRPSRFDYRFEFPLPDDSQRRAFVVHWAEKLARLGYVDAPEPAGLDEIVRSSRGMSQAYLKRVLVTTTLQMHTQEVRGDAEFTRLALQELRDAREDCALGYRSERNCADAIAASRFGFRLE